MSQAISKIEMERRKWIEDQIQWTLERGSLTDIDHKWFNWANDRLKRVVYQEFKYIKGRTNKKVNFNLNIGDVL